MREEQERMRLQMQEQQLRRAKADKVRPATFELPSLFCP
jgi:hypothetical protein